MITIPIKFLCRRNEFLAQAAQSARLAHSLWQKKHAGPADAARRDCEMAGGCAPVMTPQAP
jgi:hypothetical protein